MGRCEVAHVMDLHCTQEAGHRGPHLEWVGSKWMTWDETGKLRSVARTEDHDPAKPSPPLTLAEFEARVPSLVTQVVEAVRVAIPLSNMSPLARKQAKRWEAMKSRLAAYERLTGWLAHTLACAVTNARDDRTARCTCGMAEALAALDEGERG